MEIPGCSLKNIYQIDEGVYRSEQPTAADFAALEAFGIKEVLNLRSLHNDKDEAAGTNLKLHHIRMRAGFVGEKSLKRAVDIIENRKGPILIHCAHGSDRTGAVSALYRIQSQGISKEVAIEEMVKGGFGFHRIYGHLIRLLRGISVE